MDPMYHEKIDRLLDTYARRLAENLNQSYEIAIRCPSILVAGPANFPVRKKEKQNRADDVNLKEWRDIQGKIIVLFLFGLIFSLSSAAVTIFCGSLIAEVGGLGYKLWVAVEMGIFITAGTLPLVVLVVFFSKTYIFSILLCVFYSVLSLTVEGCYEFLPKFLCWMMPLPLLNIWCAGDMLRHGVRESVGRLEYLVPTTTHTVLILGVLSVLSILLIDWLYKKRGGD